MESDHFWSDSHGIAVTSNGPAAGRGLPSRRPRQSERLPALRLLGGPHERREGGAGQAGVGVLDLPAQHHGALVVVGEDADKVAQFLADYSGRKR